MTGGIFYMNTMTMRGPMRHSFTALCVALAAVFCSTGVTAQSPMPMTGKTKATTQNDYASSLWVKVKPEYAGMLRATNGRTATIPGVASMQPLVRGVQRPSGRRGPVAQHIDITRYHIVSLEPNARIEEALTSLKGTGYFEVIEPVYDNHPLVNPNDPSFGSQPYLNLIRTTEAWDITEGDDEMVIGIVDTGGDLDHPDLQDKLYINVLDPVDGIDNDGDGYVDNNRGWDFSGDVAGVVGTPGFQGDNDPSVPKGGIFGHGTMVAGCAAASTDNGVGIAAVGRRARLLFTKHFSDDQDAYAANYSSNTYLGVLYAATHGARIINCSWGSYHPSTIAQDIINYVTLDLGCLVIAAAGNSNLEAPIYPASYDHVLSVGSSTINDARTYFSNYGRTLDLVAPGDVIHTTAFNDGYVTDSGTSLSTPIVSGAAALVWALHPEFTPLQVAEQLRVSANPVIYDNSPAYLHKLGFGRLDVLSALTRQSPSVRVTDHELLGESGASPAAGKEASLVLNFTNYLKPTSASLVATISTSSPHVNILTTTYTIGALGTGDTRNNSDDPFKLMLLTTLPQDEVVEILVSITDGSYEDHHLINFTIPSYIEIRENNLITSLSANGRIGYGAPGTQSNGSGFLYNEESLLFDMGFIVATSPSDMYNNVRSVGGTWDEDFIGKGEMRKIMPGDRSFSEVYGSVVSHDDRLEIGYRSLLWDEDPDRNFVIIEYTVGNTSTQTIQDLYFGLFADWDIAGQGARDRADWDAETRLGYVFPVSDVQLPRTGIQVLSGQPNYRAIDNDHSLSGNPFGLYDGFTDDEKFTAISQGISRAKAGQGPSGGDVSHTVGSGPYVLQPGQTISVAFALHAAMTQHELIASAKHADTVYNLMLKAPLPVIDDLKVCADMPAVLAPSGASQYSLYRTFTGGSPVATGPRLMIDGLLRDTVVYVANADQSFESVRMPVRISVVGRPQVNAAGDLTFCEGGSVNLTTDEADGYLWTTGETTRSINATMDGAYSVSVMREGILCPSTNSQTVYVVPLPKIEAEGPVAFCEGGNVVLTATSADEYVWNTGETTRSITTSTAGTYSVLARNKGILCASASSQAVIVYPLPDATFTADPLTPVTGDLITFNAHHDGDASWTWEIDGVASGSGSAYQHTFTEDGLHTVTLIVTDVNHCSNSSSSSWGLITGVETLGGDIDLYPNPVQSDFVQISLPATTDVIVEIFDALGRRQQIHDGRGDTLTSLSVKGLQNGQYLLKITSNGRTSTQKFVVAR